MMPFSALRTVDADRRRARPCVPRYRGRVRDRGFLCLPRSFEERASEPGLWCRKSNGTGGAAKTNISAGEIDPRGIGRGIKIRRAVKTRIGKIGLRLERAAGEIGFAIEARVGERY